MYGYCESWLCKIIKTFHHHNQCFCLAASFAVVFPHYYYHTHNIIFYCWTKHLFSSCLLSPSFIGRWTKKSKITRKRRRNLLESSPLCKILWSQWITQNDTKAGNNHRSSITSFTLICSYSLLLTFPEGEGRFYAYVSIPNWNIICAGIYPHTIQNHLHIINPPMFTIFNSEFIQHNKHLL